jgi:multidrug efflux pump subunit AcrA (membrane-fusion protein)
VKWVVILLFWQPPVAAPVLVQPRSAVAVEVASVSERAAGTQASVLNASGYVTARRRATVSSKVTGKVTEVNVEEGMEVREGQVLARLDDSTLQAALQALPRAARSREAPDSESEVRLEQARVTLRARSGLRSEGLNTPSDIDNAKAEVDSLIARIASAQETGQGRREPDRDAANGDRRHRHPRAVQRRGALEGRAARRNGLPVSAGGGFTRTGISTIVDMRSLEIEVDVNESYINRVRAAQPVTAVLDAYPDWQIPAP